MDKEFEKVFSGIESRYLRELNKKLDLPESVKKELEDISTKIISVFAEKNMTYENAYFMLELVNDVLKLKSTRVKL